MMKIKNTITAAFFSCMVWIQPTARARIDEQFDIILQKTGALIQGIERARRAANAIGQDPGFHFIEERLPELQDYSKEWGTINTLLGNLQGKTASDDEKSATKKATRGLDSFRSTLRERNQRILSAIEVLRKEIEGMEKRLSDIKTKLDAETAALNK